MPQPWRKKQTPSKRKKTNAYTFYFEKIIYFYIKLGNMLYIRMHVSLFEEYSGHRLLIACVGNFLQIHCRFLNLR